jgi:hypothetical protein
MGRWSDYIAAWWLRPSAGVMATDAAASCRASSALLRRRFSVICSAARRCWRERLDAAFLGTGLDRFAGELDQAERLAGAGLVVGGGELRGWRRWFLRDFGLSGPGQTGAL